MPVPTRLGPVLALLALGAATACGTTVHGNLGTAEANALGGPASTGDGLGGTAAPNTGPAAVSGGPAASTAVTGGTTGALPAGALPSTSASAAVHVPGVTATTVYVGLIHDVNGGAVDKATGVGAITTGDDQANNRAILDDINKHGGVGGRKLVPVYANFDETSTMTLDQQYDAACQHYTQDNPRVFVVVSDASTPSFRACLEKAHVTLLSDSLPQVGESEFASDPYLFEQGYPNVDRLARYEVPSLVEQHYFTPWNTLNGQPAASGTVRVGVLTYSDITFSHAVDRILVPALKHLGYDPVVEKVSPFTRASDEGAQAAAVKSAQLAFAADNVTHVIPFESNGGLSTFFMPTARAQNYYPRYGGNSASAFEALLEAKAASAQQMQGAVGFGWVPSVDLPSSYLDRYVNAEGRHCLQVMRGAGISFTSGNAEGIALSSCADMYLIKRVLDQLDSPVTPQGFVSLIQSLGTSYQGAGTLGEDFLPSRHDAADKTYHWRYFDDCGCFHYEGALQTVP